MFIRSSAQDFGQQISYHVLGDAVKEDHIAIQSHQADEMITNGNMANLTHFVGIRSDALSSLRIGVQGIWLLADKSKKNETCSQDEQAACNKC